MPKPEQRGHKEGMRIMCPSANREQGADEAKFIWDEDDEDG